MGSVCTTQGWLHVQGMFDLDLENRRIVPRHRKGEHPMLEAQHGQRQEKAERIQCWYGWNLEFSMGRERDQT